MWRRRLIGLHRAFARFRRFRGQDRASDRLEQRQIVVGASKGQSKRRLTAPKRKTGAFARVEAYLSPLACRICSLWPLMPARVFAAGGLATGCRQASVATTGRPSDAVLRVEIVRCR